MIFPGRTMKELIRCFFLVWLKVQCFYSITFQNQLLLIKAEKKKNVNSAFQQNKTE